MVSGTTGKGKDTNERDKEQILVHDSDGGGDAVVVLGVASSARGCLHAR